MIAFTRKNLPDKFFLEETERKNLRNIIVRELIGNILIHREFTSAYPAKFIIETNRMYTENAVGQQVVELLKGLSEEIETIGNNRDRRYKIKS